MMSFLVNKGRNFLKFSSCLASKGFSFNYGSLNKCGVNNLHAQRLSTSYVFESRQLPKSSVAHRKETIGGQDINFEVLEKSNDNTAVGPSIKYEVHELCRDEDFRQTGESYRQIFDGGYMMKIKNMHVLKRMQLVFAVVSTPLFFYQFPLFYAASFAIPVAILTKVVVRKVNGMHRFATHIYFDDHNKKLKLCFINSKGKKKELVKHVSEFLPLHSVIGRSNVYVLKTFEDDKFYIDISDCYMQEIENLKNIFMLTQPYNQM